MSQENIEFARAVYETWNSGDMDAFGQMYDPAAIVRSPEGWPEPGPFVGREAIMREWEHIREAWNADAVEPISDFIDAGDRVAVRHIWRVTAAHGPQVNMEVTNVLMVRQGKIVYQEFFRDHAEALQALGLSAAMSQENIELTYRLYDAFNRRDLGAYLALVHDEVEIVPRAAAMEGGYHGHDGVRRWWENWTEAFPDYNIEVLDVRDFGELTVSAVRGRGWSGGSEVPFEDKYWNAGRWRQGKCVWWGTFDTRDEALEAVGLEE